MHLNAEDRIFFTNGFWDNRKLSSEETYIFLFQSKLKRPLAALVLAPVCIIPLRLGLDRRQSLTYSYSHQLRWGQSKGHHHGRMDSLRQCMDIQFETSIRWKQLKLQHSIPFPLTFHLFRIVKVLPLGLGRRFLVSIKDTGSKAKSFVALNFEHTQFKLTSIIFCFL